VPDDRASGPAATRVLIFGQNLTISGGAEEAQIQRLAAYVTAHMERLAKASPLTPVPHVAMLAAMNIAYELFELRSRTDAREADLDNRTQELLENIEAQFQTARAER
jgi:cell division protein ZapA (FtsZ GTPase activity inhibitor)